MPEQSPNMDAIRFRAIDEERLPLTDLQRAILGAGAMVLNEDDVNAFQAMKLKQVREARKKRRSIPLPALFVGWGLSVGLGAGGAITQIILGRVGWWIFLVGAAGAFVAAWSIGKTRRQSSPWPELLAWRKYTIGYCARGEFVYEGEKHLSLPGAGPQLPSAAFAILHRLGHAGAFCNVSVEQLDEDPFLLANLLDDGIERERYYIFAWDEEGFIPR
jgi:hypothetical protein